jgi:hypothetical protein
MTAITIPEKVQRMATRVELGLNKALTQGKGKFVEFQVDDLFRLKKCIENLKVGNENKARTQFVFNKKLKDKLPKAIIEFLK